MRMTNVERAQTVQVGDTINVQGNNGIVTEVNRMEREGTPCTYFRVKFPKDDEGSLFWTPYNNAFFGSSDTAFEYAIKREGEWL